MAYANPQSTDFLNSPDHSKGHRVYDWDTAAADGSVKVDENGKVIVNALTASQLISTDGSQALQSLSTDTYPSLTELSYVKGVESAIQTQFGTKVTGPASATDNAIARFDATTGKLIQNSVVTIADTTGNMAGVGTLSCGALVNSVRHGGGTQSQDHNTATTIFSASTAGRYEVFVYMANVGVADYTAFATVVSEGTGARIVSNNGNLLTITLSGTNVQATQTSGGAATVRWAYIKINYL